jgi:hypothetical protein
MMFVGTALFEHEKKTQACHLIFSTVRSRSRFRAYYTELIQIR